LLGKRLPEEAGKKGEDASDSDSDADQEQDSKMKGD